MDAGVLRLWRFRMNLYGELDVKVGSDRTNLRYALIYPRVILPGNGIKIIALEQQDNSVLGLIPAWAEVTDWCQ